MDICRLPATSSGPQRLPEMPVVELANNDTFLSGTVGHYHGLDHSLGVSRLVAEVFRECGPTEKAVQGMLHDFEPRPEGTPASVEGTLRALDDPVTRHGLGLQLDDTRLTRLKLNIAATDYPPTTPEFTIRYRALLEQLPPEERAQAVTEGAMLAYADQIEVSTRPFDEILSQRGLGGLSLELGRPMLDQAVSFQEQAGVETARVLQSIADSLGVEVKVPTQEEFLAALLPHTRRLREENLRRL